MVKRLTLAAVILVAITVSWGTPQAQVVRESDATSIAGILGGGQPAQVMWSFKGGPGMVLFASLDGDVYRSSTHEPAAVPLFDQAQAAEEEGCGDARERFCLQVLDGDGHVLCQGRRPGAPGWQTDPRVACTLLASGTFWIRVAWIGEGQTCADVTNLPSTMPPQPFLLNVSLRQAVPSGAPIHAAAGQSGNRF